ncbi:MAG: shikimate kinase [Faecousia sp.]
MGKGIMFFGSAGAGKSTIGSLVAQELSFTFVDIDDYI